jgi:hypothetical protein
VISPRYPKIVLDVPFYLDSYARSARPPPFTRSRSSPAGKRKEAKELEGKRQENKEAQTIEGRSVKEANTFFFWFDEDDDNLRYHSLIKRSGEPVIAGIFLNSPRNFMAIKDWQGMAGLRV